jgi:NTP pyrophosphatase (non-canonical NTP hydrolase)
MYYNELMTKLLERVIQQVQQLPEEQQDSFAVQWLAELEDEQHWDQQFSTQASQDFLQQKALEIRQAIKAGQSQNMDQSLL